MWCLAQCSGAGTSARHTVCPGVTMSPAARRWSPVDHRVPVQTSPRTTLEPEDMTGIVLFLASD